LSCPAAASARTITARLPVDTLAFLQGTERAADWRLSDLGLPTACILISSRSARCDVTAAWLLLQTRKFPQSRIVHNVSTRWPPTLLAFVWQLSDARPYASTALNGPFGGETLVQAVASRYIVDSIRLSCSHPCFNAAQPMHAV
jgi:hypothetical protein